MGCHDDNSSKAVLHSDTSRQATRTTPVPSDHKEKAEKLTHQTGREMQTACCRSRLKKAPIPSPGGRKQHRLSSVHELRLFSYSNLKEVKPICKSATIVT